MNNPQINSKSNNTEFNPFSNQSNKDFSKYREFMDFLGNEMMTTQNFIE